MEGADEDGLVGVEPLGGAADEVGVGEEPGDDLHLHTELAHQHQPTSTITNTPAPAHQHKPTSTSPPAPAHLLGPVPAAGEPVVEPSAARVVHGAPGEQVVQEVQEEVQELKEAEVQELQVHLASSAGTAPSPSSTTYT